jgi:alpha-tubulin suppressor-like RCC1 family protein
MSDGALYAFGFGAHGQLGIGQVKNLHTPALVKPFLIKPDEHVIQISAGANHSIVLSDKGYVYSCGSSHLG